MRALTLFALLYTGPALAGINVWNDYAGYHSSATNSRGFRFVIHCQKDGASSVCGNQTVTLESSDIDDAGVLQLRAAAAESNCAVGHVVGSEFDDVADDLVPTYWGNSLVTAARKSAACEHMKAWR